MSFNEKLQQLRKANKLSQEQLADMLDVTRQSVSKWESGTTYPEMDKLITMCKIFKCSLDDLTNDEVTEINVEKKQANNNLVTNMVNSILEIIEKTVKMFATMNAKQIVGVIVTLFILGCFLCILRIPFEVLENGFYRIVFNLPNKVAGTLSGLFNMILDIVFFILYVLAFVYIYKVAYLDKYEFVEKKEEKLEVSSDKEVESEKIETVKEVKIVQSRNPKDNTLFCFLGNIVLWFFRIITAFCIMPFIVTLVVLFAFGVIVVTLMFEGIVYIGVLLGIAFAIILNLWVLELGCVFIFNKKASFHRLMWTLFIGLSGVGVSLGLVALEIGNTTFIDEIPSEYELVTTTNEYQMSDDFAIDRTSYYYGEMEYVTDESITDRVVVTIEHYDEMNNPVIKLDENVLSVHVYYSGTFGRDKKMWDLIKKDLARKELRNYDDLHRITIRITSSEKNIATLKRNSKKLWEENLRLEYENDNYSLRVTLSDYEDRLNELIEENETLREKVEEFEEYKARVQDILD